MKTEQSQQKPGTDMGIYQQRHCQFELKQSRGENEERLLDFKILQVQATELYSAVNGAILQVKGRMT